MSSSPTPMPSSPRSACSHTEEIPVEKGAVEDQVPLEVVCKEDEIEEVIEQMNEEVNEEVVPETETEEIKDAPEQVGDQVHENEEGTIEEVKNSIKEVEEAIQNAAKALHEEKTEDASEDAPKKIPIEIVAAWNKGAIHCSMLNISSHFPPEESDDTKGASSYMASHAPLILAASSFCQLFVAEATKQCIEIKSLHATASGEADLTAFYRRLYSLRAKDPWKSIRVTVKVDADASLQELQMLAAQVEMQAPSKELLKEHFCVEVSLQIDTVDEDVQIDECLNIEKYKEISSGEDLVLFPNLSCARMSTVARSFRSRLMVSAFL
jgi:hypothetical protein